MIGVPNIRRNFVAAFFQWEYFVIKNVIISDNQKMISWRFAIFQTKIEF